MNKVITALLLMSFLYGCQQHKASSEPRLEPCSDEWNLAVEKAVVTGDGQGHGPDTGSQEWRSVVLFKLGKRDAVDAPDLESERWCEYVDKLVFA